MTYNYRNDYPIKASEKIEQEIFLVNEIMKLLNKKIYSSLDEFITRNNSLQEFLKNNNRETTIQHFNILEKPLTEEDYLRIIHRLKDITNNKQNSENQITESIDNKEELYKLHYLSEISLNSLNEKEKEFLIEAYDYQVKNGMTIKVDLSEGIIADQNGNVLKNFKKNGNIDIDSNYKTYQKQSKPTVTNQNN